MTEPQAAPAVVVDGAIRRYDWGSRTSIQRLLGAEVDGRPAAELWFGAHPGDPSPTPEGTLDAVITADPGRWLGHRVAERFDDRLPFLVKVLAAEKALSIQVHPTIEQARAGFTAENEAGVPLDAPHRNYSDANHKPELLCALTRFEALCGFRPVAESIALLDAIALPELGFLADALRGTDPLRAAFTVVLTHPDAEALAYALVDGADPNGPMRAAVLAAEHFPGDVGVVLSLLLNHVVLEPGEAIYLGAGIVHAYLRGTGVEIMANSDNVLRCGLTPKHIDVAELLRIVDFVETVDPRLEPSDGAFEVPVPDFRLATSVTASHDDGPRIALCTAGSLSLGELVVGAGHGLFLGPGPADLQPDGQTFVAECGLMSGDSRSAS